LLPSVVGQKKVRMAAKIPLLRGAHERFLDVGRGGKQA